MNRKTTLKAFIFNVLAFLTLAIAPARTDAQTASSYIFSNQSGTYTNLTGATDLNSAESDEGVSGAVPIGFTFNYMGTDYTSVYASSNGWLAFVSPGTVASPGNTAANLALIKRAVMPLWDDLKGGTATYKTTGVAPNRVFTVQYDNWLWSKAATAAVISFQVKLHETTGIIQFQYSRDGASVNSGSATIGIGGGVATDYLVLNGGGDTATASSATFNTTISAKPSNGRIFQFAPPCTTPVPGKTIASDTAVCLGHTVALSLESVTRGAGVTYKWQSSADGITYTNITGGTGASYIATPVAPQYYRCEVTCSAGPAAAISTPVYISFRNDDMPAVRDSSRCGFGTVVLTASAAGPGTLKWYAAASAGSALGSGGTFTTPVISDTTTYYVGLEEESTGTAAIGAGSGTTVSSGTYADRISPFDHNYGGFKAQYLFTAAELKARGLAAGNITAIMLDVVSGGIKYEGFALSIGATTSTALGTAPATGLTTVYTTTAPAGLTTPASGPCTITFTAPFSWDGTSNIVLQTCWSNNNVGGTGTRVKYDNTSFVSHNYHQSHSKTPAAICAATTMTTLSARPRVTFSGNTLCSTPRQPVTAYVNEAPAFSLSPIQAVCNDSIAKIEVTEGAADYDSVTWSPVTDLFTDAACTIAYTAGTKAKTVYFKSSVAGTIVYKALAINTASLCVSLDSATVHTLPASVTAIADPAFVCSAGTAYMSLIPASGYAPGALQWQVSSDNVTFSDIAGANSADYIPPSVTTPNYYRMVIRNTAGNVCITTNSDTVRIAKPDVLTTTDGTRCGPGSVTLGATSADGTLHWYSSTSSTTILGSGPSFATPVISATTTYYVESESSVDPTPLTIGTGALTLGTPTGQSGLTPFTGDYESQHTQYLLRASNLRAAGLRQGPIGGFSFDIVDKNSTRIYNRYTISMMHTTATDLSGGLIAVPVLPYYGPTNFNTALGENRFNFSRDFIWDGKSNIVVDVCFTNADPGSVLGTQNDAVAATAADYTATYGWYIDNTDLCGKPGGGSFASISRLPDFTFIRKGCRSGRKAVKATVNPLPKPTVTPKEPLTICEGDSVLLTAGGGGNYQWRNTSGDIPGADSAEYTVRTTGVYKAVVTLPATGCYDSTEAVNINVIPRPEVSVIPAGPVTICADSFQMLNSIHTGAEYYQWYGDGTALTWATNDSLSANLPGSYTLVASNVACSDTSNAVILNVNPLPEIAFSSAGDKRVICIGDSIMLSADAIPPGSVYQWWYNDVPLPGAVSRNYMARKTGVYAVMVRDANNCRGISDTMHLMSTPLSDLEINPKDISFCEGTLIHLYNNAGDYGATYTWSRNDTVLADTGKILTTGKHGLYSVTVKDIYDCIITSPDVSVTVYPLPGKPTVYKDGVILRTDFYKSYQWYRNNVALSGATSQRYTMIFDGKYHVVVGNEYGCFDTSDVMVVSKLGINPDAVAEQISVYPNPAQDLVYIDAPVAVSVQVMDMQGRLIYSSGSVQQIDISGWAVGVYIFRISDKEGRLIKTENVRRQE